MARTPAEINSGQAGASSANIKTFTADGPVPVPDISYISSSEMIRDGQDLILSTPEGTVIIENYFIAEPAPVILSPQGAVLTPDLVNSFVKSEAVYAQKASITDASPIGSVQEVDGEATVTRTDGSVETVRIGTPIFQGDIIETAAEGAVNIVFIDETSFAVSDNAKLAIDEYVFDPVSESGQTNFSVLRGVFVFTSGLIGRADPDDVEISTPLGSIGIRGTMIAGNVDTGEFTVIEGAIVLRTHGGHEFSLADQFATAKFDISSGGIIPLGQISASDLGSKFGSISRVSPGFFNSIGKANSSSGEDSHGGEKDASGENSGEDAGGNEAKAADDAPASDQKAAETAVQTANEAPAATETATITVPQPATTTFTTSTATTTDLSASLTTVTTASADSSLSTTSSTGTTTASSGQTTQPEPSTTTTVTNTAPPPLSFALVSYGIDNAPQWGDLVARIKVTNPDYYSNVSFSLINANQMFELVQVDGTTAVVRYIGSGLTQLTVGSSYSFGISGQSLATGKTAGLSFSVAVSDLDGISGPNALDLAGGSRPGVMALNLNGISLQDITVSSLGDRDGDGLPEFGVFGYGVDGKLNSWFFEGPSQNGVHVVGGTGDFFKMQVANVGDIDGDGKDEYILGAPGFDYGASTDSGRLVINGAPGGDMVIYGDVSGERYGISVTSLGDINKDGYADFAYSAPGEPSVYIRYGADTQAKLLDGAYMKTIAGVTPNFGASISTAGYFNNDETPDIVIGSPDEYKIYIYSTDNTSIPIRTISGAGIGTGDYKFGHTVLGGFDFNGDGRDDVIAAGGGNAYVIYGGYNITSVTALSGTNGFKIVGDSGQIVGGSVAGDFNGDGHDDIVLITTSLSSDNVYVNDIFVLYGGKAYGSSVNISSFGEEQANSSQFAFHIVWDGANINGRNIKVSSAGDLNGDGFDDILIASADTDQAFVVFGRPSFGSLGTTNPDMHAVGYNHSDPFLTIIPSSNDDSLVGNSQNNTFSDLLASSPGVSATNLSMRGGGGNDHFTIFQERVDTNAADNHRALVGGSGIDTLKIVGGGTIDLGKVDELSGIEHIDMKNDASNTLVLTRDTIFNLAQDSYINVGDYDLNGSDNYAYVLKINGDSYDAVDMNGQQFFHDPDFSSKFAGYNGYVNATGTHVVLIEASITNVSVV